MEDSKKFELHKEEQEKLFKEHQEENSWEESELGSWLSNRISLKEGLKQPEKIIRIEIPKLWLTLRVEKYKLYFTGRHDFYVLGPRGGRGSVDVMDLPELGIESVSFKYDSWNTSRDCGNLEEVYCWFRAE